MAPDDEPPDSFDSDPTNNDPPQSSGLFDSTKTNFQAYWGGDLAGIQQKLPYIAGPAVVFFRPVWEG